MALGNDDGKKPIIFDTGASLAITPDKSDFDGPLSVPNGDLRLGGMANSLRIEGMGTVTWMFTNPDGTQVRIQGLSYFMPGAKARLLSPQRLFDGTDVTGRYEGDAVSFRLHIDGCHPLMIEYDDRNSFNWRRHYWTDGRTTNEHRFDGRHESESYGRTKDTPSLASSFWSPKSAGGSTNSSCRSISVNKVRICI